MSTTKLHFFEKECLLTLIRPFYFACSDGSFPFRPVSHGHVHKQNTVAFYFTNYYNKEDALS
ncbi:MAG: hypothetical protein MR557_08930, partial [Faecalibacterium sp.]|nr:hypothetical protein [Faecalibacterium sp.]